jgi:hypothetical protein
MKKKLMMQYENKWVEEMIKLIKSQFGFMIKGCVRDIMLCTTYLKARYVH